MEFFTEFPELGRRSQMELRKGIDLAFRNFSKEYGDSIEAFFDPLLFFDLFLFITFIYIKADNSLGECIIICAPQLSILSSFFKYP